jgi:LuxR family maltose regulon positive regulatory protein
VFEQVGALAPPAANASRADAAHSADLRSLALVNLGVSEAWSL